MPDTHEDIRRRLFDAAWETPVYAPAPERTVVRARRHAATTIFGGALAVVIAVVVAAASFPVAPKERTAVPDEGLDDREYLVDIASGRVTEITETPALEGAWFLDVSPDGQRIAFTTDTTGSQQLYIANLDGSGLRQLTRGFADVAQPVWSPEGDRIAFIGLEADGVVRNIHVVDVGTGRWRRVTNESKDTWSPEWSPDGRSILFNVTVEGPEFGEEGTFLLNTPSRQLRTIDLGSRDSRKVFGGKNVEAYDATWTPMGIAFIRGRGLSPTRARQVDLVMLAGGSGVPEQLVEIPVRGDEWASTPEASPDGSTIAFVRVLDGTEQVLLLDVPTGSTRVLRPGFRISWVDTDTLLVQDWPAEDG
jgi:WD40 repeat protein